jgi:hypothetical protein
MENEPFIWVSSVENRDALEIKIFSFIRFALDMLSGKEMFVLTMSDGCHSTFSIGGKYCFLTFRNATLNSLPEKCIYTGRSTDGLSYWLIIFQLRCVFIWV